MKKNLIPLTLLAVTLSFTANIKAGDAPQSGTTGMVKGAITIDGKTEIKGYRLNEAVIYLEGESLAPKNAAAPATAVIDQKDKKYAPRVTVIVTGTTVEFHNNDPELHNVNAGCEQNEPFNVAMNEGGKPLRRVFAKPETVTLTCNVHPDMLAFVVVLENPYFVMADSTGHFEMPQVPPGTYTLTFWHERFNEVRQPITVKAGETVEVKFELERSQAIRRR